LIEVSFSRGYAKTVALSCFQRWSRARGAYINKNMSVYVFNKSNLTPA
jgi:hypothetical protein